MSLRTMSALVVLAMTLLATAAVSDAPAPDIKQEMTAAVAAVRPALVRIHVVSANYTQGRQMKREGSGSGVIISPEGYVVTNHHVAGDAERLVCTLADKREVNAALVGTDPLADIAVIKLVSPDGKPFPSATWGDSTKLEVGDRVFAMGSPYALSQSVTMGIVSNADLILPYFISSEDFELEGEDVGSIVKWIGHDAQISPGNSGGPLLNRAGEIVGINEISLGLSGAIPSSLASGVAAQLVRQGKVTRCWLGIEVQPLLESSGLTSGILVSGVIQGSPAEKAGFQAGDILMDLDGTPVAASFREQVPAFNQFVADLPVGKATTARVLRQGKEIRLTATTAERPKAEDRQHELRSWGITASDITYMLQKELRLSSQDGVLIGSVLPSGPAGTAKPSLEEGDVILKVASEQVKSLSELRAVTAKLLEGRTEPLPVVTYFSRNHEYWATVVKIGRKEPSRPGAEIQKAWLPIDSQVLTRELAEALGVDGKTGVRVTKIHAGSTAEKAGLKVGDLLTKLDGEDIEADQEGDDEVLPSLIRQYDIGAEVKLGVIRAGKPLDIGVKLEASPKPTRDYPKYEDESFEFTARDIAFSDQWSGSLAPGQSGAYVESVAEGSWSALGGLRTSDVVVAVDGAPVAKLSDLKSAMAAIAAKRPEHVVLKVHRGIHTLFLEIEPEWPAESGN